MTVHVQRNLTVVNIEYIGKIQRIWDPFYTKVPKRNLYLWHVKYLHTSLYNANIQSLHGYDTSYAIQMNLDELYFV